MQQATCDLQAADHLLQGAFAAQATVFAHLAVEKALKALYRARVKETPPVTHDVRRLAESLDLEVGRDLCDALDGLCNVSIVHLYDPDRPFGHPVSDRMASARERVADARAWVGWAQHHLAEA
jgi:HEPN domain-containing protein